MKSRRGWIRIVEAFVALLLIMGATLIVLNKGVGGGNIEERVYEIQAQILRDVQLDNELRSDILNVKPASGGDINTESHNENGILTLTDSTKDIDDSVNAGLFPSRVWNRIDNRLLDYNFLECRAKICKLSSACGLDNYPDKEVFVQPVAIAASTSQATLESRQLKLFCWEK